MILYSLGFVCPYPNSYEDMMMGPSVTSETESEMKEYEEAPESLNEPRERLGLGLSLRDQEYLKHSSLFSRQHEDDQPPSGISDSLFFSIICIPQVLHQTGGRWKKVSTCRNNYQVEGKLKKQKKKIGNCQKSNFAISLISCSTSWPLINKWMGGRAKLLGFVNAASNELRNHVSSRVLQNRSHVVDERRIFSFFLVPSISMSWSYQ